MNSHGIKRAAGDVHRVAGEFHRVVGNGATRGDAVNSRVLLKGAAADIDSVAHRVAGAKPGAHNLAAGRDRAVGDIDGVAADLGLATLRVGMSAIHGVNRAAGDGERIVPDVVRLRIARVDCIQLVPRAVRDGQGLEAVGEPEVVVVDGIARLGVRGRGLGVERHGPRRRHAATRYPQRDGESQSNLSFMCKTATQKRKAARNSRTAHTATILRTDAATDRRCPVNYSATLPVTFCNFTHRHAAVPHFAPDHFVDFVHGAPPYRFPAACYVLQCGSAICHEMLL